MNYFCVPFLKVKIEDQKQENDLHIIHNLYIRWVQTIQLAKSMVFKTYFQKFPLSTTPCLTVSERCIGFNFHWYGFE